MERLVQKNESGALIIHPSNPIYVAQDSLGVLGRSEQGKHYLLAWTSKSAFWDYWKVNAGRPNKRGKGKLIAVERPWKELCEWARSRFHAVMLDPKIDNTGSKHCADLNDALFEWMRQCAEIIDSTPSEDVMWVERLDEDHPGLDLDSPR